MWVGDDVALGHNVEQKTVIGFVGYDTRFFGSGGGVVDQLSVAFPFGQQKIRGSVCPLMARNAVVLLEYQLLDAVVLEQVDLLSGKDDVARRGAIDRLVEKCVFDLSAHVGKTEPDVGRLFRNVFELDIDVPLIVRTRQVYGYQR